MAEAVKLNKRTRETAIRLLKDGQSTDNLVKRYKGRYTKRQFASLKAQITMGRI
jgi:hypothetical protein